MRAPNFAAWTTARSANSPPSEACREAEVILDPHAAAGLTAGPMRSSTTVSSPSDAPYTAAASPAGPAPTIARS